MKCNICGTLLTNNYCPNCKNTNINNQNFQGNYVYNSNLYEENINTKYLTEKSRCRKIAKIIVISFATWCVFSFIMLTFDFFHNSCLKTIDPSTCSISCNLDCMPPFYFLYIIFYSLLTAGYFMVFPCLAILLLDHLVRSFRYKKSIKSLQKNK